MNLKIGDYFELKRVFTSSDVEKFAKLSGDNNPIHLDDEYAKESIFKKRIVHGLFAASIFSRIIGTKFPGEGSIYLEQNLKFTKPIYPDLEYVFKVQILDKREDKPIYTLETICLSPEGEICISGKAIIKKN